MQETPLRTGIRITLPVPVGRSNRGDPRWGWVTAEFLANGLADCSPAAFRSTRPSLKNFKGNNPKKNSAQPCLKFFVNPGKIIPSPPHRKNFKNGPKFF